MTWVLKGGHTGPVSLLTGPQCWGSGQVGPATAPSRVFDRTLSHSEGVCLSFCCHWGYNYYGLLRISPKEFALVHLILASQETLQWTCLPKDNQINKIFGLQNKSWAWHHLPRPLSALPSLQTPCAQRVAEFSKEEHKLLHQARASVSRARVHLKSRMKIKNCFLPNLC